MDNCFLLKSKFLIFENQLMGLLATKERVTQKSKTLIENHREQFKYISR